MVSRVQTNSEAAANLGDLMKSEVSVVFLFFFLSYLQHNVELTREKRSLCAATSKYCEGENSVASQCESTPPWRESGSRGETSSQFPGYGRHLSFFSCLFPPLVQVEEITLFCSHSTSYPSNYTHCYARIPLDAATSWNENMVRCFLRS